MTSFGSVYRRGRIWWVQYCHRGEVLRESSHSASKTDARELLRARLAELAVGYSPALMRETGFEQLANLLAQDYSINGRKSAPDLSYRIAHLRRYFGRLTASEMGFECMTGYIAARRAEGAAPGTVKLELASLGKMFTLAVRSRRLAVKPPMPTIALNNARTGFFETEDVERVAGYLPASIAAVVRFAYLTGWRRSEVLGLEWRCVDATGVRLEPGATKNGEGRLYPMTGPLSELLEARRARTSELERATARVIPLVFTWEDGRPIRCFRSAWKSAVNRAGLPGRIFHDLRRSAVRHLVRCGVSETVAMQLSGHKTRAIFDRYNIVSSADLIEAARKAHER